jgi:DNA polymerase I
MEFEKVYKSIIFVSKRNEEGGAKKKYAVLPYWVNGKMVKDKMEYSGFEAVRSDSPRIAREIQETVLDMVLRKRKREDVDLYLKNTYNDIISGKIPEAKVASPKRIKESLMSYKTANPIVTGALYSNKYLGTRFSRGDKPKFLYIRAVPPGYPSTDVITFEDKLPEGFVPDWDKIMERIFKMKLEDIYRVKGWEWDWRNIKEVKQQKLGF